MQTETVRMIADIATPTGLLISGNDYEMPADVAEALLYMGWAERVPTEITPEQHAQDLRQRRAGLG